MSDRTVDRVTGEIIEAPATGCERCLAEHKRGETIRADLLAAEASLRRERRRSQALEGQIRRQLEEDPKAQEIREVLTYWQERLDHPTAKVPIDGERAKRVRTALRHKHTVAELKEAIDGAAAVPYVLDGQGRRETGTPDQRRDDLDLICRDETTIKRFRGYAQRAAERERAAVELTELLAKLEGTRQTREGQWAARCPAHDDRHASLSVAEGEKGVVLHCHSGCQPAAITAALDVGMSALFASNGGPPAKTRVAAPAATPAVPLPSEADIEAFAQRLAGNEKLLARLVELRHWTAPTLFALEVGFDGERLTLPVRDAHGRLINVMKYRPGGAKPKLLPWASGHGRGLFPAPETIPGQDLWVVEGEPDGITGRELGLPVVGVPGANAWRNEWAERLAGRRVVVVADADEPGRAAAARVARSVAAHAAEVRLLDLDESRMDGYDLTDSAMEGASAKVLRALAAEAPVVTP